MFWEYNYVSSPAGVTLDKYTEALNELGLDSWELVGFSIGGFGANRIGAILKRARARLAPPADGTTESWLPDPSGRHPDRWWDGSTWTQWVRDHEGGTREDDPPYGDVVFSVAT